MSSLSNDTELPDLQINNFVVPETAIAGNTVDVSWTVENLGTDNSSAAAWIDAIYLSDDETLDEDDLLVDLRTTEAGETPLTTLGGSYDATQTITLPENILGSQFLLLATDWNVRNLESDETNNIAIASIEIVAPAPEEVTPGDGPLTSPITQFDYDATGNLERTIDARENITRNEYDELDRLVKTIEEITGEEDKVTEFE